MATQQLVDRAVSPLHAIPLLDASNLPSADDWAFLEALQPDADLAEDVEPDFDRFGRFRLTASFDE
jgi:hypothetical protein